MFIGLSWLAISIGVATFITTAGDIPPASIHERVFALFHAWFETSGSTAAFIGDTHGKTNPGLTALTLRLVGVSSQTAYADLITSLSLCLGFGLAWRKMGKTLRLQNPSLDWAIWLALTPCVHPLPWLHLFAFAFPLGAWGVREILTSRKPSLPTLMAALGVFLLCFGSRKVLGPAGAFLELSAGKSWGVLLLVTAAWRVHSKQRTAAA